MRLPGMPATSNALLSHLDDAMAATRRGDTAAAISLVSRVALALPAGTDRETAVALLALLHARSGRATRATELRATIDR